MEFGSILQFLENKNILITGAAGYLAKILVEKVLRVQPNVKKLYLLLRASDAKSAFHRFQTEAVNKDLFKILKEKWGGNLNSLISEKIAFVPGDMSFDEDLGVKESNLKDEMWKELDVIINLAATTNFDERYDVALGINTIGVRHLMCFAKKCVKLKVLVQVSTAYVSGEKAGLIQESPYSFNETLNGVLGLDIDEEKKLVDDKLNQLHAEGASDKHIKEAMRNMGIQRAKLYGWPNTYVFTKAMGEMIVGEMKGNLSVVIVRPTIVTSTINEPFPGWVEGVRTVDSLALGYATGRLTCFLGDINGVVDVIPADMVINAILVATVAHANGARLDGKDEKAIYHVGSSVRHPVRYKNLQDYGLAYFTNKPWIDKDGKPIRVGKVKVLDSMTSFRRYMAIRYILLLKGLEVANTAFCRYFDGMYKDLNRKINYVMRLVELYKPYLFFKGIFDDTNTEKLRLAARKNLGGEKDLFYFDPTSINWEDYVTNVHIPGVVKYVFK